ncbi:MAG: zf-HC2 domain-containing protein [Burkholderiales bacterium]|nr:MAG: zf-HC2 domain-containing protein [Burkholderiales bacterium]
MILRRTCKEAAALLVAREDRALSLPDRVALRLHLAACRACPAFERQLLTMRQALGRWRHYSAQEDPPLQH